MKIEPIIILLNLRITKKSPDTRLDMIVLYRRTRIVIGAMVLKPKHPFLSLPLSMSEWASA